MFALILHGRVHELFRSKPVLHPAFKVVPVGADVQVGMEQLPDGSFAFPPEPSVDLGSLKRGKQDAVNAKRDAVIQSGYQHNFGGAAGIRTLDNRTGDDATNWLWLKGVVDAMIATGRDADMVQMRDANDQTFHASARTVSTALLSMAQWRSKIVAHAWTLKDKIAAASNKAAIDAVDINAGWPA